MSHSADEFSLLLHLPEVQHLRVDRYVSQASKNKVWFIYVWFGVCSICSHKGTLPVRQRSTAAAEMVVSRLQITERTQAELTELMVLASAVLAVMTELPVSSTACRAFRITVLLPMWVTLLMGTTQCLQ